MKLTTGRHRDLSGRKFGRLLVVAISPRTTSQRVFWECKCDCGKGSTHRADVLVKGGVKSCGCLREEIRRITKHGPQLLGQRFGRLVVVESRGADKQRRALWLCRCDCGGSAITRTGSLHDGSTVSCGCFRIDRIRECGTSHGQSRSRIYRIWQNLKQRCSNPLATKFHNYGGRGIRFCEEWGTFEPFYEWAIRNGYQDHLTLDRIDVDGHYAPDNCRWATFREQNLNKRCSK